ncbi:HNH endonuclease [Pseudomonas syringae]|uniref:HNH endonuclease n=1 Tax=Pseudomonas syringae TaxID=317 RepID=UPI0032D953A8
MPEIIISGRTVLFDEEDHGLITGKGWRVMDNNGKLYVVRYSPGGEGSSLELFHRTVMGSPKGMLIDHKSGETLDCRKENLRVCNHAQNMRNRKISKANKSGFKGVHECSKSPGTYIAQITIDGSKLRLGRFKDPAEAHSAYCAAATKYHGEFARTA